MGIFSQIQSRVTRSSLKRKPKHVALDRDAVLNVLKQLKVEGYPHSLDDERYIDRITVENNIVRLSFLLDNQFESLKEKIRVETIRALGALPNVAGLHVQTRTVAPTPRETSAATPKKALSSVRNVIAVASGKGGVGKSSCALNLAYALKQTGASVGILDADVYGPSMVKMTGVKMPEYMQEGRVIPPEKDGIKVISTAMFQTEASAFVLRGPMATQIINQFLNQVEWGDLDVLIIDFPPGTGDVQITLSQQAQITGAVIVTTPQEVALIDARKAAHMFSTVRVPILGVIENMSYFQCATHEKPHYIFGKDGGKALAEELNVPLLAEIPIEEALAVSCDAGRAVVKVLPDSAVARAFSEAALSIAKATVDQKRFKPFAFNWQEEVGV